MITLDDGTRFVVPLDVIVHDVSLPSTSSVGTNLFSLDVPSIAYRYGADFDSRALVRLVEGGSRLLASHRIVPDLATASPTPDSGRPLPTVLEPAAGEPFVLGFAPGDAAMLAGPMFEDMGDRFAIELDATVPTGAPDGTLLRHAWFGRPSGYAVSLEDGRLSFSARVRFDGWLDGGGRA